MEEDIKILEELIKHNYLEDVGYLREDNDYEKFNQAIENLIKGYRELEENNQQIEKWLNYYKLGDTVEEFEELFGNTPINDIEKIKKYIFQNYIPKSKIKEKIEANQKLFDETKNNIYLYFNIALQELMEDK